MSWMSLLYQTYENNKALAGKSGEAVPLSVVAHMVVVAQIEITLDPEGNFLNAVVIKKEDGKTLVPVTESSAGRASGIAPHALSDTLSYVAGDYKKYAVTEKEAKRSENKFLAYEKALSRWKGSPYSHPKVEAIYRYVEKQSMIQDLVNRGIIQLDERGKFSSNKISGQPYEKAMVRFVITTGEFDQSPRTWEDETLFHSYTNYYLSSQTGGEDICYLTGQYSTITTNHPKGIIPSNYGAKLISANDTSNFVFRGRFHTSTEACTVSYEASQKVHNALTWLLQNRELR